MMAQLRAVYLEQMKEPPKVVSREMKTAVHWVQKRDLSMVGSRESQKEPEKQSEHC
jgi:hypothetical protein